MAFESGRSEYPCGICKTPWKWFKLRESEFSPEIDDPQNIEQDRIVADGGHVDTKKKVRICAECELANRLKMPIDRRPAYDEDWATERGVQRDMKRANKGRVWSATGMHYAAAAKMIDSSGEELTKTERRKAKTVKAKELADAFLHVIRTGGGTHEGRQ